MTLTLETISDSLQPLTRTPATLLALVLLLVVPLVRAYLRRRNDDVHRLQAPPHAHWMWGHEKEANFDRPFGEAYSEWKDTLPTPPGGEANGVGAFRVKSAFWAGDLLVLHDPLAISRVIARQVYTGKYAKSSLFRTLTARIVGRGIVWAEGEDHRRMAKALSGTFNKEKVKSWMGIVNESADRMVSMLRAHVASVEPSSEGQGVVTNMIDWPSRATLDIIGRICFSHDFQCGESYEAKEIFRLWREMSDMGLELPGFTANRLLHAFPFLYHLIPTKFKEAQGATKLHIHQLAGDLIRNEQALAAPGTHSDSSPVLFDASSKSGDSASENDNLLSALFRASLREEGRVDMGELLDQISTYVVAGHESASSVISWAVLMLAQNADVQTKLRAELDASPFGLDARNPGYDELIDARALPYLDAFVKEALRTFSPIGQTERVALEDDVIPLQNPVLTTDGQIIDSIRVRKGQEIFVSWQSVNTNRTTWGPDGPSFRPERWLAASSSPEVEAAPRAVLNGWQHLGTFSEGPRMCPGYRLAVVEVKQILLSLVSAFEFENVDKAPVAGGDNGETMDVTVQLTFSAMTRPRVVNGERVGMAGGWVPVKVKTRSGF